jgi:hypothetical protein
LEKNSRVSLQRGPFILRAEQHFSFGRKEKEQKWIRFLSLRRRQRQYKSIPYQNKMIYLRMQYILQIRPRRREMAAEKESEMTTWIKG